MDIEGGYNPVDAGGFIKINTIRLMAHRKITTRSGAHEILVKRSRLRLYVSDAD